MTEPNNSDSVSTHPAQNDLLKIRIKLGENEFEAEGPSDRVERHIATFARLMKGEPAIEPAIEAPAPETKPGGMALFQTIVMQQGPIRFLNVPARYPDAILLILLAQKVFRKHTEVSGAQIMEGLRRSGLKIPRADRLLQQHAKEGFVDYKGEGRSRTYSLTPKGIERAEALVSVYLPLKPIRNNPTATAT